MKIPNHADGYTPLAVSIFQNGAGGDGVITGAHCYEFFAGPAAFAELAHAEPGTFYLTDYLLRHFDRLVIQGLGIDRHPELMKTYFGNYRRLVYLAQAPKPDAEAAARKVADRLGLELVVRQTGYGGLGSTLRNFAERPVVRTWPA